MEMQMDGWGLNILSIVTLVFRIGQTCSSLVLQRVSSLFFFIMVFIPLFQT